MTDNVRSINSAATRSVLKHLNSARSWKHSPTSGEAVQEGEFMEHCPYKKLISSWSFVMFSFWTPRNGSTLGAKKKKNPV